MSLLCLVTSAFLPALDNQAELIVVAMLIVVLGVRVLLPLLVLLPAHGGGAARPPAATRTG